MPNYIVKLTQGDKSWYLEWSTIVDAPITYGMTLEEFRQWYREEYGRDGISKLEERLERVERTGTSSFQRFELEHLLEMNRAGVKESCLTKGEIIQHYCIDRPKG